MGLELPKIVSFYTPDPYYKKWGKRFISRLDELNSKNKKTRSGPVFDYDIVEIEKGKNDWSTMCCRKQQFIKDKMIEHGKILWIDIDTFLYALPNGVEDYDFDVAWEQHFRVKGRPSSNQNTVLCDVCYAQNSIHSRRFFDETIKAVKDVSEGGDHDGMLQVWYKFITEQGQITKRNTARANGEPDMKFGFLDASWRKIGISGNEMLPSNATVNVIEQYHGGNFAANSPEGDSNMPPKVKRKPSRPKRTAKRKILNLKKNVNPKGRVGIKNIGRRKR
jgi:hypothetical protein